MAKKHTKLELTWIGKGDDPKLEPRILIEDPAKRISVPIPADGTATDDNLLIHGDNLLALKALEQEYTGKVKCIYIDPPYNTGSAFEHYDDGVQHSQWLSLISPRLKLLYKLLDKSGSIWISIDDNECHYLKVICDEIFGRQNFITSVTWEKKYAPKSDSKFLSESHDYVLAYAKNIEHLSLNRLPKTEKQTGRYTNKDNDPRGPWKPDNVLRNEARDYAIFPVTLPSGRQVWPPPGTSWRYTKEKFNELINDNRIWFGLNGDGRPAYKRFISEVSETIPSTTIWKYDEVGHNDEAKKEARVFNTNEIFATPKPERLLQRILTLATNLGDLVLDSFLGSGTTAAVAQKMGRKWIGIELGQHAVTHCYPRLNAVCEGTDPGGISKAVGWQGGGGFRFYTLAPSLLREDKWGNLVINEAYNADQLAAAMAKQEGFRYQPHESLYWKQAQSSEHDFLFTTTQFMTVEHLDRIHEEMKSGVDTPGESLLICCKSFQDACTHRYPTITLKKIPVMLLGRCEFNRNDYSFTIVNSPGLDSPLDTDVPVAPAVSDEELIQAIEPKASRVKPKKADDQLNLF